tara:strand:- start:41515 stop:41883 length:369 start_codon:yes stop_codon:yes gene_type:complete
MYLSISVNRSYLLATEQTVDHQLELDAINYGNSVSELMYSQIKNYATLDANYGGFSNINNPINRLNFTTSIRNELSATITLSAEQEVLQGVNGRVATITVYAWENGIPIQKTQHLAPIIALQ